mgnify:CR=1 FL=1
MTGVQTCALPIFEVGVVKAVKKKKEPQKSVQAVFIGCFCLLRHTQKKAYIKAGLDKTVVSLDNGLDNG